MRHKMVLPVMVVSISLAGAGRFTAEEQVSADTGKATIAANEAARESERQARLSDDAVRIVGDLKEVMDDARSNDLFTQAGGQTLDGIQKSLGDTERDDVRPAAANLRAASELSQQSRPRLDSAHVEIVAAIDEMDKLLRKFHTLQSEEQIAAAVQEVVHEQSEVTQQSIELGKKQLQKKKLGAEETEKEAAEQERVARSAADLAKLFEDTKKENFAPEFLAKLQDAQDFTKQHQIVPQLERAAANLHQKEVLPAVEKQEEALANLQKMSKMFTSPEQAAPISSEQAQELAEALGNLLAEQRALREQTQKMSPTKFPAGAPEARLSQLTLRHKLQAISGLDAPQEAQPHEALAGEAATAMQQAADSLDKKEQKPAVAAMQQAEAALAQAQAAAQALADAAGQGQGQGQGQGKGKGKGQGKGKGRGKGTGGHGTLSNQATPRQFTAEGVAGEAPKKDRATWQSLDSQDRRNMNENFARELPPEYRELLKAYYEYLSKQ